MFDLKGEVIGIVSSILLPSGGSDGLGFAATSNIARCLLLDEPSVWSGLEGYLLTGEAAEDSRRLFRMKNCLSAAM